MTKTRSCKCEEMPKEGEVFMYCCYYFVCELHIEEHRKDHEEEK